MEVTERPLVSFALLAYNQERFIREAVSGALAQTYSPLEIILSDDCSTDGTFEIMRQIAASYQGPNKVALNRNASNLGLGGHVNRAMEISAGPLVVLAAGDDVSYPERVRSLCQEWLRQKRVPTSIHSDVEVIDEAGREIPDNRLRNDFAGIRSAGFSDIRGFLRGTHRAAHIHGATHAFSRALFKEFGPLNEDVFFEDTVIAFRSWLFGSFAYVPSKLVRYRRHDTNLWSRRLDPRTSYRQQVRQKFKQMAINTQRWIAVLHNFRDDVRRFSTRGGLPNADTLLALREIDRRLRERACEYRIYASPPWISFFALLQRLLLRPDWRYGWCATKQWLLRTADFAGLLSNQPRTACLPGQVEPHHERTTHRR